MLNKSRKAMTLVELIITMTILATIASIAVISADDLGENSRYEQTDRRGKLIQKSLVGFDTPRFVQDMGRLPLILVDAAKYSSDEDELLARQKLFLAELCELEDSNALVYNYDNARRMKKRECTISTYLGAYDAAGTTEITSDDLPSSVSLNAGWAGPYALSGTENMTDNWGKPWDIYHYYDENSDGENTEDELKWATKLDSETFDDTNDEIEMFDEILGIRSIYNEDYASDLSYKFPRDNIFTDITIKLFDKDGEAIITTADDSDPDVSVYKYIRIFLYLPYCPPKTTENGDDNSNETNYPNPKIMELCLWDNNGSQGLKIRCDTNGDGNVAAGETLRYTGDATDDTYPTYLKTRFNADESSSAQLALDDFPVGTRKIWAYAVKADSDDEGIYAPLQTVKITSTNKTIEIQLTETF